MVLAAWQFPKGYRQIDYPFLSDGKKYGGVAPTGAALLIPAGR
jgi:hypothetical protein